MVQRSTVTTVLQSPSNSLIGSDKQAKAKETAVLLTKSVDEVYATEKDFGSLKKRKREFYVGLVCGIICCVYALFVLTL